MVGQDVCCVVCLDDPFVQVVEHLLHTLLAFVVKEEHGDRFLTEGGVFLDGLGNRRASVLAVVDDEVGLLKIHFQKSESVGVDWLESDLAIVGGCN